MRRAASPAAGIANREETDCGMIDLLFQADPELVLGLCAAYS